MLDDNFSCSIYHSEITIGEGFRLVRTERWNSDFVHSVFLMCPYFVFIVFLSLLCPNCLSVVCLRPRSVPCDVI